MNQTLPDHDISAELERQRDALVAWMRSAGRVAVAFSGGVDSAVVAQAAALGAGPQAVAVTAVSPSLASGELELAQQVAQQIGIRHVAMQTREFTNPAYLQNLGDRCYHCKSELYTQLELRADELGVDVIVNGANLDDRGDYRPGMQAADEHAVRSPLIEIGLTKADVRALARHWNLAVWDKPAAPCLSSRIAYGLEVTPERVSRVDQAEQYLRETWGLREFRVRHEAHDLARLEVPVAELPRLIAEPARSEITARLHQLGFKFIALDLDGFRSGSLNAALPLVSLAAEPRG